ncbi:macro domain-containing protein [Agathobaculum sp. LCP25S3_E8]|uniref:macro domain-containing protein n=1 Tax=Agathobaculum sp. LCP25S3_E8 TaxID=3438735 RepID=UPI003F8DF5A3
MENVTTALIAVVDAIRRRGHCDTLCVPLIGSGRTAIREAIKKIVSQKTIDCFVQSEDKVVSKLIVSIHPKDYLNGEIDLDRVKRYLNYKFEFC